MFLAVSRLGVPLAQAGICFMQPTFAPAFSPPLTLHAGLLKALSVLPSPACPGTVQFFRVCLPRMSACTLTAACTEDVSVLSLWITRALPPRKAACILIAVSTDAFAADSASTTTFSAATIVIVATADVSEFGVGWKKDAVLLGIGNDCNKVEHFRVKLGLDSGSVASSRELQLKASCTERARCKSSSCTGMSTAASQASSFTSFLITSSISAARSCRALVTMRVEFDSPISASWYHLALARPVGSFRTFLACC
mmetsp:Transcript_66816/g.183285  ORF Transcript_66816/g.183285 Transcript_66816/m.183285 type:complete len:254 (+) Transcript_66816:971-1732(+)